MRTFMPKNGSSLITLCCVLSVFVMKGCFDKDTCNRNATFSSMHALAGAQDSIAAPRVEVFWSQGEALPLRYFTQIKIEQATNDPYGRPWQNDWRMLDSIQVVELGKFSLRLKTSLAPDSTKLLQLHFVLPDRRGYIDCDHPGSPDSYGLDLSFRLNKNASNELVLKDFTWDEQLFKGGY